MAKRLSTPLLALVLAFGIWSCSDDEDPTITGPEFPVDNGVVFKIRALDFPSVDGVQVNAWIGENNDDIASPQPQPVIILVHDFTLDNQEWIQTPHYVEMLRRGYFVVAIDMRGHGGTPLPENRQVLALEDLENTYRDVGAALLWLEGQPQADLSRVAVVGTGVGGNVSFVSMGVFPQQIKTAVVLSAGLWVEGSQPVVVGNGLEDFAPHSVLYIVGGDDVIALDGGGNLSFPLFAQSLAEETSEPKDLVILNQSTAHGIDLLDDPSAAATFFRWLDDHL